METFSPKLDKISENLIYLLSLNSRQSVSNLSRELNLNRKIVENRVNNLFKKRYIKYLLVTNEKKRVRFTVLVKLSKVNNDLIQRLKKTKGLLKLKETLGVYDLSILFDVYSQKDAEKTISQVSKLLHNGILTFDVLFHDFEDTLGYKSFCRDPKHFAKYNIVSSNSSSLSKKEELILNSLKKNPNSSYAALAKETGLNYSKLKETVAKLTNNKLIRFSVDPDYNKLQLEFHNILLKIKPGKKGLFEKYIKTHKRIHWVKYCQGRWDYVLSVTSRDINEFIDISKHIRTENNNSILEETSLISKVEETRKY